MNELEGKISAWRTRMSAALPGQEETLRELECHVRDHIASLRRRGVADDEAFATSVQRLGEAHGIAREFSHVRAPWWPASWVLRSVLGLLAAVNLLVLFLIAGKLWAGSITPLVAVHVSLITAGYFTVFATGLIAGCAWVKAWRRSLGVTERRELRDVIFRLSAASSVVLPIGLGLGMIWAADNLGAAWTWSRLEVGALCVTISTVLLCATQLRATGSDALRWSLSLIGGATVVLGIGLGGALTPAVPVMWLGVALVVAQGAAVMLRLPIQPRVTRE